MLTILYIPISDGWEGKENFETNNLTTMGNKTFTKD